MKGVAIIAAAGSGSRAGVDKVWAKIEGETVLQRSVRPFLSSYLVDAVVVAVRAEKVKDAEALFAGAPKPVLIVSGGDARTKTVKRALAVIKERFGTENVVVAVHDGARPFVTTALIERCMSFAASVGSAVPVAPCSDSLRKKTESGSRAVNRAEYFSVQTPQCFDFSKLYEAYAGGEEATDDATLFEQKFGTVALVEGDPKNKKITYLSDIYENFAARVGVGYDVHELAAGRALILGGVRIPHDKGLVGHSDADALTHAIMDALLTAADLPDIGHFFPPDDPAYEGACSLDLLRTVRGEIEAKGFAVKNVSATVMAQKPKLAPYLTEMERKIAGVLGVDKSCVRFAATTTEKLGIVGEEKGIAAEAVALLRAKND